jgi:uncharacterized protein (DUF608 family)
MFRLSSLTAVIMLSLTSVIWALSGTNGTPLGGMGTGYVVFNGVTGEIAASGKNPPAGADGYEFTSRKSSSAGFYLFANGAGKAKAKAVSEDAKCPLYQSDFGAVGSVNFTLKAFGPYLPGDDPDNFKLATSPLAFFEITAVNSGAAAVDVAVALEFANTNGSGSLLGGATSGTVEAGNQAISYTGTNDNAYLAIDCDGATSAYSAGAIGTFLTNGTLSNAAGNAVAAKCSVPANGTARFKFTLAWWRKYESTGTRYGGLCLENYLYHNYYSDSKAAATFGRSKFDAVKNGLLSFVNRTMSSNFPAWYKDRLLNNTYPLIHNSQLAKDGRLAFWEGKYGIIGTIDQGEHASLFYTFNWPQVQWQELQYWKRTARQEAAIKGQIHHDVNQGVGQFASGYDIARFMCPWDYYNHDDYWWFPKTETWSDLNSMFIFKAYELMLATGNRDSMVAYFPQIKTTADRILAQAALSNTKIPLNCHSTYDESTDGGKTFNFSPEYCGGVALPTYLAVVEIAKFVGQDSVAARFRQYYETGRAEYRTKFVNDANYGTGKDYSEGDVAGYSWANYFCFEPIMDSDFVSSANKKLWNYYNARTESGVDPIRAKLGKWGFYTCDHWGGVEIALGKPDTALIIHKWDYTYYYEKAPNMVFWQNLRKELAERSNYASYMTAPTVWRSYFQMIGYLIDNANQRLWIRPRIPTEMNKEIKDAILLNPKSLGTLNYSEIVEGTRTQTMTVKFDKPVTIKEFMLKNNTGLTEPGVAVYNGASAVTGFTVKTEGSGYEKNIRVTLSAPIQIGPDGVKIEVFAGAVGINKGVKAVYPSYSLSVMNRYLRTGTNIHFSVDRTGPVSMELLSINGAKIGTIMRNDLSAGEHNFLWNGKTLEGKTISSSLVILRLSSLSGSITKSICTGR